MGGMAIRSRRENIPPFVFGVGRSEWGTAVARRQERFPAGMFVRIELFRDPKENIRLG